MEDEYYVRIVHEMTKKHYISFIAALSSDRIQMVKLYPEGNAEARFKINGVKQFFIIVTGMECTSPWTAIVQGGSRVDNFALSFLSEQRQIDVIKKTNDYTNQFGLCLSDDQIQGLMTCRRECLAEQQRVEFGQGVLDKIIFAFCDSQYISQENYAETLARLQEIFYLYKNESMDELTDDELLLIMRNAFDDECQGSLEYLEETFLDQFARNIRANTHKFIGRYVKDDEKI